MKLNKVDIQLLSFITNLLDDPYRYQYIEDEELAQVFKETEGQENINIAQMRLSRMKLVRAGKIEYEKSNYRLPN
ncbi:hypothetical protein [Formosa algae]|uniref:hypothetical protein n=1 Tax=Formosa algae TaxID=225843 RepID=UPI000CCFBC8C|nr:hypothetical protein [Formosa algae]PNW28939.1 hypothetical protein BKP44_06775 [Formosa algae]